MRISRFYIAIIMAVVILTAVYVSQVLPASHSSAHPAVSGVLEAAQRTAQDLPFGRVTLISDRPALSATSAGEPNTDSRAASATVRSDAAGTNRRQAAETEQAQGAGWTINATGVSPPRPTSQGDRSVHAASSAQHAPVQHALQRSPNPQRVTPSRVVPTNAASSARTLPQDQPSSVQPIDRDDDIAGYPLFRNYSPADYGTDLPSQNWSITQDDRGIMYIGNLAGVLSYDGATWRLIPTKNQTLVRTVFRDSTGRIYVGAYGEIGYLSPDETGTTRFVSLERKIPEAHRDFGQVLSGVAVESGVYFQTRRAIYRWDGSSVDVWTTTDASRFYKIFSVRDIVYVARENIGLHRIVNGQLEQIPGGERFENTSVETVLPHGDRGLLIGTADSELFVRRGEGLVRFETQIDGFLQANELYTAAILPGGSYAFATLWGGVVITDPDGRTRRLLDERAGLIGDDVKGLYVDQQDGLWIAYESGIARAEIALPISMYDERTDLDGVGLTIERHDGDLHVGTTSGVFRLTRGIGPEDTVRPKFERVSPLRAQVFSLLSAPGGLLAATDRGIFQIRENRVRPVGESRTAHSLHASRYGDGLVYVGYIDGVGTLRYEQGRWQRGERISGIDRAIFFLEEDAQGDLWAASAYGGLWNVSITDGLRTAPSVTDESLDGSPAVTQIASEGQRPQHVFRMSYSDALGLRIAARDGIVRPQRSETGRIRLDRDTTMTDLLPDDTQRILNVSAAPDGDLWVTTQSEMYWLKRTADQHFAVEVPFAYVPEFNAYASRAEVNGWLWVTGEEGVVSHRPVSYPRRAPDVRTLIRNVSLIRTDSVLFGGTEGPAQVTAKAAESRVSSPVSSPTVAPGEASPEGLSPRSTPQANTVTPAVRAASPDDPPPAETLAPTSSAQAGGAPSAQDAAPVQLPYEHNAVRLDFAAPGFGQEESVEYQYRLDGFDPSWSPWSSETKKEYTNLPPGKYRFDVRARNPRVWNASVARYSFEILAPWYRTVWAYAAYALLMGGIVFGAVQLRSAQLEWRARELEQVIADRTAEVKQQARQLEVFNTELVRSNEVLQETVEEKSKLLGVAAHDLKNPLFGIRALSEVLIEREDVGERAERKLHLIRESAEETLTLINNLLNSAASSAHAQTEMEMIDAAALAEWVTQSFQLQADRKGQTLTCSVPSSACMVEADKRKLREAMNNLISNAIKYSPHDAPIEVIVDRDDHEISFSVRDEGPGLSPEDQKRLFTPFQRLTPEPTGDEGSSGLGLYIVQQIAYLHDGDVMVETELGEGSTFTLILPAASAGPHASYSPSSSPSSSGENAQAS